MLIAIKKSTYSEIIEVLERVNSEKLVSRDSSGELISQRQDIDLETELRKIFNLWEICEINPSLDTLNTLAENSLGIFESVVNTVGDRLGQ